MEALNQHGIHADSVKESDDGPAEEDVDTAVNSTCAWGVACNTGAGMGRFVPEPHIVSA